MTGTVRRWGLLHGVWYAAVLFAGCGDDGGGADSSGEADAEVASADATVSFPDAGTADGAGGEPRPGARPDASMQPMQPMQPSEPGPPGTSCTCDADCEGSADHPALCVLGICMTRASAECSAGGSSAECPEGSRCWGLSGSDIPLCWPDCASFDCAGACDSDGSCVPVEGSSCDPACGSLCGEGSGECSPENPMGACSGDDEACIDGACVEACSPTNASGYCPTGSACEGGECISTTGCPTWMCTGSRCTSLISMPGSYDRRSSQAQSDGYYIATEARYAYLRRDLTMLLQYAACEVATRFPGTAPIGIADLSQADGLTPGADVGRERHPSGTHTGSDMDLAYYQTDGANNPQIICGDGSDTNGNGRPGQHNDGYFCTTDSNIVDWPRQAYWFAKLASSPLVRVFGIDETLPDDFRRELNALHDAGDITEGEHQRALRLGYGNANGWAYHHHHTHMSYNAP